MSYGDKIDLIINANTCNGPNTVWVLYAYCYGTTTTLGSRSFEIPKIDDYIEDVFIYPNPFDDNITIEVPPNFGDYTIDIVSTNGQKYYSDILHNENNTLKINTYSYPSGVYFIKIVSDENEFIRKFTKN